VKHSLKTSFHLNLKVLALFLSGLLLTVYGIEVVYQSKIAHDFLVFVNPVGRTATLLSIALIFIALFSRQTNKAGQRCSPITSPYAVVIIFFLTVWISFLPSLASWATADSYVYSIGGILQTKDASAYITGAEQLIETGEFGQWNQRRPLNTVLLSSRMVLSGLDFRNALLLQAGLFGISIFFVILLIWRQFGTVAAGLMYFLNFAFVAYYLPTTLSESLGMSLALMALAFFLLSVQTEKRTYYYFGLFVMTLALLTRTGPMFVIPFFVLYAGWLYSGNIRYSFKEVAIAVFPVILAILFNYSLNLFYGDATVGSKGSFHYVLYKIAVGGSHWEQARFDYAVEFKKLSSTAFADLVYARSLEAIASNPLAVISRYFYLIFSDGIRFLYGIYGAYMYLVYPDNVLKSLESFFSLDHDQVTYLKEWLVSVLGVFFMLAVSYGIFQLAVFARKESTLHLSLLGVIGAILSIPLLYSFAGLRVFITAIPFLVLFLVLSLIAVRHVNSIKTVHLHDISVERSIGSYMITFLSLLLFFAAVMPVISYSIYGRKISSESQDVKNFTCTESAFEKDIKKIVMWTGPGIQHIEIVSDEEVARSFSPVIRESDFVLGQQHERRLRNVEMKPGTVIFSGYDQLSRRRLYLAASAGFLAGEPGYRLICARVNNETGRFPWFVTDHREM